MRASHSTSKALSSLSNGGDRLLSPLLLVVRAELDIANYNTRTQKLGLDILRYVNSFVESYCCYPKFSSLYNKSAYVLFKGMWRIYDEK